MINYSEINAHSSVAYPSEIFSIWNGTSPTLNGLIDFSSKSNNQEWSYTAIYDLYDYTNAISGKLLLQNDNTNLYIGLDGINYHDATPTTDWGCTIYFDLDHNGFLSSVDRTLYFISNSTDDFVIFRGYNANTKNWYVLEWGNPGTTLTTSGILLDTNFDTSDFNNVTNHRQYEIKIPFSALASSTGKTLGIAFEVTDDYNTQNAGITWPYIETNLFYIRTRANVWGDITFAEEFKNNFDLIVEKNLKVKSSAYGVNNGTFMTAADIDGNGDKELIVSSNRTVLGDNHLLAIFDYKDGTYQRIWASWTTSHQSLITFTISDIAAFDFNGDGKDEIYAVGKATTILRFSDWNTLTNDFDTSEIIFTHTAQINGYLAIGDASNDTFADLVFGDINAKVNVLEYNSLTDSFSQDSPRSPFTPKFSLLPVYRIHDIAIGNMDSDLTEELLFYSQITSDDTLGITRLQIFERTTAKYQDNAFDDLPNDPPATMEDQFGHTIVVADVDNDLCNEVIMVGKNYLRIFSNTTFSNPSPPLEILLNDGQASPKFAGGAIVTDINNDGKNELLFGANNGTLYLGYVTDEGSSFTFHLNWSSDFGSCLGFHEAIVAEDFDGDGYNEIAIGDNFGQIFIFGKGKIPQISITSPSSGYISSQENVLVKWTAADDLHSLHYFELYVNGMFKNKFGAGQREAIVYLTPGQNNITIIGYDFSGFTQTKWITVKFDVKAPQVTITSPANNYATKVDVVEISYYNTDPDDDFDYYKIYRNSTHLGDTFDESYFVDLPNSGHWNITVVAVDDTLLEGRSSIIVIRDNLAPEISIVSPMDGVAVKVTDLEVTWTASDSLTEIDYYNVYLDSSFYDTTTAKTMIISLDTDKSYLIEVRAYDIIGNSQTDSITISRDTVNPTITIDPITLPQLDSSVYYTNNQLLSISWTGSDNLLGSGISYYQITINGYLYNTYSASTTNAVLNLSTDNLKNIFVTAFDKAGNSDNDYITVIYDTTAPNVSINTPQNDFVTGLTYVTISWSAHDAGVGIQNYIVYVDDIYEAIITNPIITSYLVSIPENRTYKITIKATDILGYTSEQSINVTHDGNAPTLYLTSPTSFQSYSNTTTINLSWDISNLDVDYFEIYKNGTYYNTYTNDTFDAIIDVGVVLPGEYPLYNITVVVVAIDFKTYIDYRWITFDLTNPLVEITNPINNEIILEHNLVVDWSGSDVGSGIDQFILIVDNIKIYKESTKFFHIINVENFDGVINLKLIAFDNAGNKEIDSINIMISLLAPEFSTTISSLTIQNHPDLQFNLSIYNPRLGIKSISVMVDSSTEVFSANYEPYYVTNPFWILISITEDDYIGNLDLHNITVSVIDQVNRENKGFYKIIIDQINPKIWQAPILGSQILNQQKNSLEITAPSSSNIYNLTAIIEEKYALSYVKLRIVGTDYNETFDMLLDLSGTSGSLKQYYLEIDFNNFTSGEYQLIFLFEDVAGNSNSQTYTLSLTIYEEPNGRNYLTIIIIASVTIVLILAFVLVIVLKRPVSNIGWEKELVLVAYILRSGLTALFVPYSTEIITDEQLFGGAMTGIRGILEEIIGTKVPYNVEVVEFGQRNLLIYPGDYGDAIAIVKNIKPNHARILAKFSQDFEEKYKSALEDDTQVSLRAYRGAISLVRSYFGEGENLEKLEYQITDLERQKIIDEIGVPSEKPAESTMVSSFYQEVVSKYGTLDELSSDVKVLIGDSIILAEQSLTLLISGDYKQAEKKAAASLKSLELARQSDDPLIKFKTIFDKLPKYLEMIIQGALHGRKGHTEELHKAIEEASQLFIEQII
ncbi:MAG TPA: FG-GAP-like repeat-containing protein [Candidatus Bathyarchaeia archaeon]|nr:FG-GAP-like repeat-containing protein [Candidatus Bathyarchaeia archaeon]